MEPGEDLVIRLTSAVTLRSALDDFEFNAEQFLPFLERTFSLLYTLLKEAEECETKVCIYFIRLVCRRHCWTRYRLYLSR